MIPLLPETKKLVDEYLEQHRPTPLESETDAIFIQRDGTALLKFTAGGPQNYVARKFTKLMVRAGLRAAPVITRQNKKKVQKSAGSGDGRGFRSLRTSFANFAPPGFRDEVEIVMGHQTGSVLVESYIETIGLDRLKQLVRAVWKTAFSSLRDGSKKSGAAEEKPAVAGTT